MLAKRSALGVALISLSCSRATPPPREARDAPEQEKLVATETPKPKPIAQDSHGGALLPVTDADPQWGSADAPVTIVEFGNFECPFSSRVTPTLEQIKRTYGPRQVRIVWKHHPLPFHKAARPIHEAAATVHALGGDFWKFHDLAFRYQWALRQANVSKWAKEAGVDVAAFEAAFNMRQFDSKVTEDIALAQKVGASGTPAFRINGVAVNGAKPFPTFKEIIDQQLAEAEALLASGTAASDVYPILVAKNAKLAPEEEEAPPFDGTVWKVPVYDDDPVKGRKDALVTIVQFSAFQCPPCRRAVPILEQVQKVYGDDVRIVWKDNPVEFYLRDRPAANLARAIYRAKGDAGFWAAHDMLFALPLRLEDGELKTAFANIGVPWATLEQAMKSDLHADKFEKNQQLAMDVKARGTPHFFVNGVRLAVAETFDEFKELIDVQLNRANAVVAKGTPRAKVYDELMKGGEEPPPPPKKEVSAPLEDSPSKGNPKAKIVIQVFSNFECPFCSRVNPTIDRIIAAHGQDVKIVWRHLALPVHKNAPLAAEAAHEAYVQKGDKAFWQFHDKLFAAQGTPGGIERDNLEKFALELGLDMSQFRSALDEHTHRGRIIADMQAARDAGIHHVPGFVINGYYLSGAQPYVAFEKVIQRALAQWAGRPRRK